MKACSRALPCCMFARKAEQRLVLCVLCYCNGQLLNCSAVVDNFVWEASEFYTVKVLKGMKNLSASLNSGVSAFQEFQSMAVNRLFVYFFLLFIIFFFVVVIHGCQPQTPTVIPQINFALYHRLFRLDGLLTRPTQIFKSTGSTGARITFDITAE